jgi:Transcriptional regulator
MDGILELYRIFYTVANYGNISLAAKNLHITQPAVSRSIMKLEDHLGIRLFARSSRGVKLTGEGKLFYAYVDRAMSELTKGEELVKKLLQRETGKITLSVSTTLFKHFLVPKLESFIKDYPHIEVNVANQTTFDSLKRLDDEQIDLCIISRPFDCSKYYFIELAEIQDIFVASPGYIAALGEENILSAGTFMFLEDGNITREYVERGLKEQGLTINPEIVLGSMEFLIEFAKIGMGIASVIKDFVQPELAAGTLVELSALPVIPKRSIGVAYNRSMHLSTAASTFLDTMIHKNE